MMAVVASASARNFCASAEVKKFACTQVGELTSAITTNKPRNACARQAWKIPISSLSKVTRIPPSTPCKMTAATAVNPSNRTQRRGSVRQSHPARISVRSPTVDAINR